MAGRFSAHLADYQHIFQNKTKRFFDKAEIYGKGVLMSNLRNIERISEAMDADYFQMQHFITESKWDHRELIDQVAVFAALNNGDFASLVDARLYLPQDWSENPVRCDEVGIPEEQRTFKTKLDLALEIVKHQISSGISVE